MIYDMIYKCAVPSSPIKLSWVIFVDCRATRTLANKIEESRKRDLPNIDTPRPSCRNTDISNKHTATLFQKSCATSIPKSSVSAKDVIFGLVKLDCFIINNNIIPEE